MKLDAIAQHLDCLLDGDGNIEIRGLAGMEDAGPNELTFLSNLKYVKKLKNCRAGAIILSPDAPETKIPHLISKNPYLSFARAVNLFHEPLEPTPGIHPTASIAATAQLGEDYSIGANVVIGEDVRIGDRAILHPNTTIYPHARIGDDFLAHSQVVVRERSVIGDRVSLQNGAVIGGDGFGFAPTEDGSFEKITQAGIVILEDDVDIGSNTCIDRATIGETRIKSGTKIDNLVQIGHGSVVGENTALAAQVGLAGSTKVGDRVMLGGQVGAAGHLTIGDDVIAIAQTGIAKDVESGSRISGSPELDVRVWRRNYYVLQRLPALLRRVRSLERQLSEHGRVKKDTEASDT